MFDNEEESPEVGPKLLTDAEIKYLESHHNGLPDKIVGFSGVELPDLMVGSDNPKAKEALKAKGIDLEMHPSEDGQTVMVTVSKISSNGEVVSLEVARVRNVDESKVDCKAFVAVDSECSGCAGSFKESFSAEGVECENCGEESSQGVKEKTVSVPQNLVKVAELKEAERVEIPNAVEETETDSFLSRFKKVLSASLEEDEVDDSKKTYRISADKLREQKVFIRVGDILEETQPEVEIKPVKKTAPAVSAEVAEEVVPVEKVKAPVKEVLAEKLTWEEKEFPALDALKAGFNRIAVDFSENVDNLARDNWREEDRLRDEFHKEAKTIKKDLDALLDKDPQNIDLLLFGKVFFAYPDEDGRENFSSFEEDDTLPEFYNRLAEAIQYSIEHDTEFVERYHLVEMQEIEGEEFRDLNANFDDLEKVRVGALSKKDHQEYEDKLFGVSTKVDRFLDKKPFNTEYLLLEARVRNLYRDL